MSRKAIVIGLGEVGAALLAVLQNTYGDRVVGYDIREGEKPTEFFDQLHICLPYFEDFVRQVNAYKSFFQPAITVIHSTVPVGTTAKVLGMTCHSPVLGDHTNMRSSLSHFFKWVGGPGAGLAAEFMGEAGITCRVVEKSEETELLKLFCLAKFGLAVAINKLEAQAFEKYGLDPADITAWDHNHNAGLIGVGKGLLGRQIINPQPGPIGGHCVVPGVRLLADAFPHPLLSGVLAFAEAPTGAKVWQPSNVYHTAKLGKDVNVGAFCEIGSEVVIGDRTRVGAHSFIPEGFTIGQDVFIGPRFCGTNDKYPPSSRENWLKTTIKDGARIGAAVTVLCGVTIHEGALVGAGSLVTHDIPAGEKWCGVPARKMEPKETIHEPNSVPTI